MLLFAILGAMTVVTLVLLVLPLLRHGRALTPRAAYDLEIYRDQLGELERDLEQGVIDPEQAALARTEIERRMLKAAAPENQTTEETAPGAGRLMTAFAIALALPLAAGSLYLWLGEPGVESIPFAQRPASGQADLAGGEGAPDMDSMVERLARRLATQPDDLEGWLMLARSYGFLERYDEAVAAYRHATALTGNDPAILAALAESQVGAAGGMVTPAALETFAQVIEMDPGNPAALFYQALALAQAGDVEGALEHWVALGRETPADAPWLPGLRFQIEEVARASGLDAAGYLAALPEPAEAPPLPAAPGPSEEDMAAAGEMSPEEQQAMIRSMVERLAERLEKEPGDLEGWLRLARAYDVLGEAGAASDAWARAAGLAPGDAQVLESYAIALVETAPRNEPLTPAVVGAFERLADVDPENPVALWHLGRAAAEMGDAAAARGYWQRLLAHLPPGSDQHAAVSEAIDGLGEAPPGG